MTDEEIARRALYSLHVLSGQQLEQEQFESQALAIIAEAVSVGRREGEAAGFTMGTRHARDVQAFVLERCFLKPITAAEVAKAEETKS